MAFTATTARRCSTPPPPTTPGPGPCSGSTTTSEVERPLRARAATRWRRCSTASRPTGGPRCGTPCTSGPRWPGEMTELPKALRDRLAGRDRPGPERWPTVAWPTAARPSSGRSTRRGRGRIETVLMAYPDRVTVCVSTQAGCAMACPFCATGQGGFTRHLTGGEIVEQVALGHARAPGHPRRVHGHGRAAGQLRPDTGSRSGACTTTWASRPDGSPSRPSGSCPGIRRLSAEGIPVNLAVSLHAANDELPRRAGPDQPALPAGQHWPRRAPTTSRRPGAGCRSSGR